MQSALLLFGDLRHNVNGRADAVAKELLDNGTARLGPSSRKRGRDAHEQGKLQVQHKAFIDAVRRDRVELGLGALAIPQSEELNLALTLDDTSAGAWRQQASWGGCRLYTLTFRALGAALTVESISGILQSYGEAGHAAMQVQLAREAGRCAWIQS